MPPPGRRPGTQELLPGLSLRKALALVLGVWVLCTLIMFHQHSFVAVSRFDYSDTVLDALPFVALKVGHLAEIDTNAAQSVAFVPVEDDPRRPYALVLVANYFGKSGLFALRANTRPHVQPLAVLQTECGHSWAVWRQSGRRWAAVANYCSEDQHKGVVVYELEPLATSASQAPDWGFKAAAAIAANGSSYVLHMRLPFGPAQAPGSGSGSASGSESGSGKDALSLAGRGTGQQQQQQRPTWQDALAVAEYGSGHWVLYGLSDSEEDKGGLVVSELQRTQLRGIAALALCSTAGDGGGGGGDGGDGGDIFLVGLSYYDKGFATRSAVYRWHPDKRHFVLLQVLVTHGAHGARCFTMRDGAAASDGAAGAGGGGAGGSSLFLAIANSRQGDNFATNSTLWRYDPGSDRFILHQLIPTVGAHDVAHLRLAPARAARGGAAAVAAAASAAARLGTRAGRAGSSTSSSPSPSAGEMVDVLVFANRGADQVCSPSEVSPLLAWVSERQRFEPAAHLAGLQCATGLAAGRLGGAALLLATGDRTANGSTAGPLTHVWHVEVDGAARRRGGGGGGGGGGGRGGVGERRRAGERR